MVASGGVTGRPAINLLNLFVRDVALKSVSFQEPRRPRSSSSKDNEVEFKQSTTKPQNQFDDDGFRLRVRAAALEPKV